MGFFGTEVPTPTVSMMRGEGNSHPMPSPMTLDCYDTDNNGTNASLDAGGNIMTGSADAADTQFNMNEVRPDSRTAQ